MLKFSNNLLPSIFDIREWNFWKGSCNLAYGILLNFVKVFPEVGKSLMLDHIEKM